MLCQPARTHRDPGGKPSGARVYYPSLRFLQSTLDDSGHNQGEPSLTLQAMQLLLVPTQGCQELSHTENDECMAVATRSTSQCCSSHNAHGHQPKGTGDTVLLTKANAIITVEGSRLQPGDVLDTLRPTRVRHQPPVGL